MNKNFTFGFSVEEECILISTIGGDQIEVRTASFLEETCSMNYIVSVNSHEPLGSCLPSCGAQTAERYLEGGVQGIKCHSKERTMCFKNT